MESGEHRHVAGDKKYQIEVDSSGIPKIVRTNIISTEGRDQSGSHMTVGEGGPPLDRRIEFRIRFRF